MKLETYIDFIQNRKKVKRYPDFYEKKSALFCTFYYFLQKKVKNG